MQASVSELEYVAKKKRSCRDRFFGEIEAITPWVELNRAIAIGTGEDLTASPSAGHTGPYTAVQ